MLARPLILFLLGLVSGLMIWTAADVYQYRAEHAAAVMP